MASTPSTVSIPPSELLASYRAAAAEREALGVPPLPLNAPQTEALTQLLREPPLEKRPSCWTCSASASPLGWTKRPT